jgi:thiamine monophosphate synthase
VFESGTKQQAFAPTGVDALAAAAALAAPRPLVAIGGVDAARAPALRSAGAAGFAVIGAVAGAADPAAAVRALARAWQDAG